MIPNSKILLYISICLIFGLSLGCIGGKEQDPSVLNNKLIFEEEELFQRISKISNSPLLEVYKDVRAKLDILHASDNAIKSQQDCHEIVEKIVVMSYLRENTQNLASNAVQLEHKISSIRDLLKQNRTEAEKIKSIIDKEISFNVENVSGIISKNNSDLNAWRNRRNEKFMYSNEDESFLYFCEDAEKQYAIISREIKKIEDLENFMLNKIEPQIKSLIEHNHNELSDIKANIVELEGILKKIKSLPVSQEVFNNRKNDLLATFNEEIILSIQTLIDEKKQYPDFENKINVDINKLKHDAEIYLRSMSEFELGDLYKYLQEDIKQRTLNLKPQIDGEIKKIDDTFKEYSSLLNQTFDLWKKNEALYSEATDAVEEIKKMNRVDELVFYKNIKLVEAFIFTFRENGFPKNINNLSSKQEFLEKALTKSRVSLDSFKEESIGAKNQASIKLEVEKFNQRKLQVQSEIKNIQSVLLAPLTSGYAYPKEEKELLLKRINFFLQGIDNMSKQSLINEHTYIKNQFQSLKGKIKWTPGARHSKFSNIYATEEQNVWASDPGYSFDEPGTSNLSTHWQPGARHPNYPHVYAGNSKQTWLPDPGYTSSYDNDLNPKWTSGATHPKQKHLHASAIEGKWELEPGYVVTNQPQKVEDYIVVWREGINHPNNRGIVSAKKEGEWNLRDGWKWVSSEPGDLRTQWVPGSKNDAFPHIHAGNEPNRWVPDDGYKFVSLLDDGDLSVVWTPGLISADGKRRAREEEGRFENKRDCGACRNGYKYRMENCTQCGKTGKARKYGIFVTDEPCPTCKGAKRVKVNYPCERCDGEGSYWP